MNRSRFRIVLSLLPVMIASPALAATERAQWRVVNPASLSVESLGNEAVDALLSSDARISNEMAESLSARVIHQSKSGVKVSELRQHINGIEVFGRRGLVLSDRSGEPAKARHNFRNVSPAQVRSVPGFSSAKGRKFWVASGDVLVPATLSYRNQGSGEDFHMMAELRSWPDGGLIRSASVTDRLAVDYRIYDQDDPYGHNQPHPTGVQDGFLPAVEVPQVVVNIDEVSVLRDDPWLPDGATGSVGNNIDSFFNSIRNDDGTCDFNAFDGVGGWGLEFGDLDFRAQLKPSGFDYPYVEALSEFDFRHSFSAGCPVPDPTDTQVNAKLVQNFYWGNLLHDWFYDVGFDEAAGNAQQDNFGRGGVEGDRMIIHGGAATTFVSTPGDGESPVMVIGLNSRTFTDRDSSLDFSLFAHEWGHYLVRRLVGGGGAFLSTTQARSLNEGWADFIGVLVNVREADFSAIAPGETSSYAVGSYFNRDYNPIISTATSTGTPDAYFYGIRRWPLGPSNPLMFRHMAHEEPLPAGFDFYDWKGRTIHNTEIHTAGEIWSAAMWDCARAVLSRDDRSFGKNWSRVAEYTVVGMKLTPVDPTILEARDALLSAIEAMDSQDHQVCRATFASRGMGSGALSAPRDSRAMTDLVESFADEDFDITIVSSSLEDDVEGVDSDGILDFGETGTLTTLVRNTGFRHIQTLRLKPVSTADHRIKHPELLVDLLPGAEAEVTFEVELLHDRDYDPSAFEFEWKAVDQGAQAQGLASVVHRTHFDIEAFAGPHDAELPETFADWTQDRIEEPFFIDSTWDRVDTGGNTVYRAGEIYARADQALVSRPLMVGDAEDFRITFDHAHQLSGMYDIYAVDKGVVYVEISTDGGSSWNTELMLGGNSAGFPALLPTEVNLGMAYALQQVLVRFRLQTFTASIFDGAGFVYVPVDEAWLIDNIGFAGITNQPFTRVVPEDGS
ncbi:MAG: hypothetical protein HKN15_02295 [Xanthomonadales bacterium]|nr:hypothetical protein [Xanthomonadales bacterium]